MENIYNIFNLWYVKALFGVVLAIVSPINITIITIFIMIILDMITGILCAIKTRRFNSRTLRKSLKKILTYCTSVLTVRLVEYSVLMSESTTILTQIIGGFLIITEAVSILENLTVLGLPLPIGFVNIIFKQIRIMGLEELFNKSEQVRKELQDIEDILYYQIPSIKSVQLRKLLEVKLKIWFKIAKRICDYFDNVGESDNDLIYYKVSSIIQSGFEEMSENWVKESISTCDINKFNERNRARLSGWMNEIKEVCYRLNTISSKRKEILKKIKILIYETVIDAQKSENEFTCMN